MTARLTIVLLAIACLVVAGLDILVLGWDKARPWAVNEDSKARVDRTLEVRSEELRTLQARSDDDRDAIFAVMDGMNEIVNLGRAPNGLAQARTLWEELAPSVEIARQATLDLPNVTKEILDSADAGRAEIRRLGRLLKDQNQEEYLNAVDAALQVMIDTHHVYEPLNAKMIEGFAIYEQLIAQTTELLSRQSEGGFRNDRSAADFYNLRTKDLLEQLNRFRTELDPLAKSAEEAAIRARDAFAAVERAQGRVR